MTRTVFAGVLLIAVYLATAIGSMPAFLTFNFGQVSFEQVLFFLTTEDGTMGTDRLVLLSALEMLIVKPLAVAIGVTLIAWLIGLAGAQYTRRTETQRTKLHANPDSLSCPQSKPLASRLLPRFALMVLMMLPFVSAYSTLDKLGGVAFFAKHDGPDQFAKLYVNPPATLETSLAAPRNLILLYVESLETTFSDPDYFAVDLNAPLSKAFDRKPMGIKEMAGTNWTTAGMVASQCAVPLATFIWNKAEFKPGAMLGNARCLGDYLSALGYSQHFLVGPELKFSGMDKFYRNHGYQHTVGKQELLEAGMPADKLTGWGGSINDDTLLELALDQILALHADFERGGKPFNVTVITTDNHAPDGYLSPRCPASDLEPSFARVIECTNRFVASFYEQLEAAGVLKDTVLVVMGDHLFMNNPEQDHYLPARENRRVYFNYRSPGGEVCGSVASEMTHFDVAPTVLALLTGSQIRRMGVGDNLCQPVDITVKRARNAILEDDIASHSNAYRSLW
ncbi:MAG: sulfatase-like hydrolase/transferase [Burkholderiaceae bacterium]|nr:sulfatase-like hydrolase/transferase [Burkholderiaceae bacterium]